MASDANQSSANAKADAGANASPPKEQAHADATAHKEAYEYWGYLIKPDKCGTDMFNRLLEGIWTVIGKTFEPSSSPDITPSQIAAFYRAVGGDYDQLFLETPPSSISFIYRSLGAFHSLQPAPDDDGYSAPSIPALKQKGFVIWQTIQLLLGPEEHVVFLQNAVRMFDVVDPANGQVFLKSLPADCLPSEPDKAMVEWHEGVAERLKREAEEDIDKARERDKGRGSAYPKVHVTIDEHAPRSSSDFSNDDESAADGRSGAAKYFADPLYRKQHARRPPIVRHFSKEARGGRWSSGREYDVDEKEDRDRGRLINSVRHMLNPFGRGDRERERERDRRRSLPPGRWIDYSDDDATPLAVPIHPSRYANAPVPAPHKRPVHPPRRESTLSSSESDSDSDGPPSRRRTPILRQRRSHDPPARTEYFPQYYEDSRRYSHDMPPSTRKDDPLAPVPPPTQPPVYGPTKAPLFATHVAQMQANHGYYSGSSDAGRRPSMPPRTSYRPSPGPAPQNVHPGVRYSVPPSGHTSESHDSPYGRERDSHHSSHHAHDRERDRDREAYSPLSGSSRHRRRLSEDLPRDRDSERVRAMMEAERERTRSHERVRDEWDERAGAGSRGGSRSGSRDRRKSGGRERDGLRYVSGVADAGGKTGKGRRYPVEQPWR